MRRLRLSLEDTTVPGTMSCAVRVIGLDQLLGYRDVGWFMQQVLRDLEDELNRGQGPITPWNQPVPDLFESEPFRIETPTPEQRRRLEEWLRDNPFDPAMLQNGVKSLNPAPKPAKSDWCF